MAKIKTILDSLDETPDALHEYFIEKDGKFILDLEGVNDHPEVIALRNALARQKEDRRKAVEELSALKSRLANIPEDFDPEEYERLKTELEALKADPTRKQPDGGEKERAELATARKNLEQKIARMEKDHAAQLEKKENEIKKRQAKINSLLIDDGLTKSLIEAGVAKEYLKAAKALLRDECSVVDDGDDYRAVVQSDMGEMEIPRYVNDWVASDEGKVFVPPAKGGDAGAGSGTKQRIIAGEKNPWSPDHWNMTEQGKIFREDKGRAEKLAKAAGSRIGATAPTPKREAAA